MKKNLSINHHLHNYTHVLRHLAQPILWFLGGIFLGAVVVTLFAFIFFQTHFTNTVYPGVIIGNINFGGKTKAQVEAYFASKNQIIDQSTFTFKADNQTATVSAKDLGVGYDTHKIAQQAYSVGRSGDRKYNLQSIINAYIKGNSIPLFYQKQVYTKIDTILKPIAQNEYIAPVNAVFQFQNGKVTAFKRGINGQEADINAVKQQVAQKADSLIINQRPQQISIAIPIKSVKPEISNDQADNLGIKELIGEGASLFQHSAPERIYNVELAAERINGTLIKPGGEFSFDQAVGDISSLSGYKQAYIISNGKTVLGDGGGVCQVSTTVFRAALHSGLPITERHAHAYRVGYYEEDSGPGIDATIYSPTVDLKFRNDTGHYILLQTSVNPSTLKLTIDLYGTKDGRIAYVGTPIITSTTPAPPPLYQDDPNLPAGTLQQTDFAANGADVYFTYKVVRNGQTLINQTYYSNYQPWQAVFLRGTKTS